MTLTQQRWRIVPFLVFSFLLSSTATFVTFAMFNARDINIHWIMWPVLAFSDLVSMVFLAYSASIIARPGTITIDPEGFRLSQFGKARSWRWGEVSKFRLSGSPGGAGGIWFNVERPGKDR